MTRVIVLDEMWYPQGGGAELATYLYTKKMLETGFKVSLVTNRNATFANLKSEFSLTVLPFGKPTNAKPTLLLASPLIKRKVKRLALTHDIAYIPGKLLFLAPWLKKINPSLRIIIHLHDYQLVCPHSSLHNFIYHDRCRFIWSDFTCAKCTRRFELAHGTNFLTSSIGSMATLAWKRATDPVEIIDSADTLVTVSKKQSSLISDSLNGYSDGFVRKNMTVYNPIDTDISYVRPKFDRRVCVGFFGGDKYLKGFDDAVEMVERYQDGRSLKLLATKISASSTNERFEFFRTLNKKEMADIFQRVWIVLFTSVSEEPLPYIIIEAQMRGRPVVATSVGGVAETIVKPGFTGSVVERGEFESFQYFIKKYSSLLTEDSLTYTKDVSDLSRDFFEARTIQSYDSFLKIMH